MGSRKLEIHMILRFLKVDESGAMVVAEFFERIVLPRPFRIHEPTCVFLLQGFPLVIAGMGRDKS